MAAGRGSTGRCWCKPWHLLWRRRCAICSAAGQLERISCTYISAKALLLQSFCHQHIFLCAVQACVLLPAGGGRRQEGMGRHSVVRLPAVLRPALHRHQGTAWGGAGDYQTANQSRLAAARVPCRSRCYDWLLPCCSCCTLPCCRRRRTSALESRSAWRMGSGTLCLQQRATTASAVARLTRCPADT